MAFIYAETLRPKLRRFVWSFTDGPTGEFVRAAVLGSFGVAGLALVLPGAVPAAVTMAVAVFCLASVAAGWVLHRDYPHDRLGFCNYVTLVRLGLVCALMAPPMVGGYLSWPFFALAAVALSLDGVDGWLARREDLVSASGARFDVEVDSVLALVLALNAALSSDIGLAVILLGLPRYAFGIASHALPWMRRQLPERFSRKAVCVLQLGTLVALQAPILPPIAAVVAVPIVAVALVWSFSKDASWLWQRRA